MLKIKADKMKNLEKFGFKEHSEAYFNCYYFILIDKNTRKIQIINSSGDLLFDLIASGMVEKVVEDERQ